MNMKKCEKAVAWTLVISLFCSTTFIKSAHAEVDKPSEEGLTITTSSTGEDVATMTLTDDLSQMDYNINIRQQNNGMIRSETYDNNGDLLNIIIQEGDELIQYDNAGRVLVRNHLSEGATNSINENVIGPLATSWEAKSYVKSNTNVDISNQANAASMLIATVAAIAGVGALASVFIGAINSIASWVVTNKVRTLWYKGWKQYGWDWGHRVVRLNLDFYRYSNDTGFVKKVSGMQSVH